MKESNLNKVLHEKVMGECWHEPFQWCSTDGDTLYYECLKCSHIFKNIQEERPDYLRDPAAYWRLLQKVNEGDWVKFVNWFYKTYGRNVHTIWRVTTDQQRGCEAIADFFVPGWRDL